MLLYLKSDVVLTPPPLFLPASTLPIPEETSQRYFQKFHMRLAQFRVSEHKQLLA